MFRSSFMLYRNISKISNSLCCGSIPLNKSLISPVTCISSKYWSVNGYSTNIDKNVNKSVDQNKVIYSGLLKKQIIGVKIFSLSSSMIGVGMQPVMYQKVVELGSTPVVLGMVTFVGFFTFVTPLLLHWITKKYVTDIEYDPTTKKYTATLYTFFIRKKKIEFTPDDVNVPDLPGMFTSMHIRDIPVFIELSHFKDPTHYATIMGYDKPINFSMPTNVESDSLKK